MFRKKLFITLVKDGKVDFIPGDYPDRYRDYCSGRERLYLTLKQHGQKRIDSQGSGWESVVKAGQGDLTSPGG